MSEEILPLWLAFRDGARLSTPAGPVTVACHDIGPIALPTGRIVACDPFTEVHTRAFARHVEPSSYPVFLSVMRWDDGRDERTAAAMIQFSEGAPVRWELAVEPNANVFRDRAGYDVDSGRGCFLDRSAARYLLRQMERGRRERVLRPVEAQLDEHYRPTWSWANVELTVPTRARLVAFTTGMGDSCYRSYFGFDERSELVCLTTDFLVRGWATPENDVP